ncbi:MAG: 3-phosphoshikimate 1-carboxyvinyltransferase [Acidobacteriota bacterium]
MRVAHGVTVHPASRVRGCLRVPGDKSISHRYALLAALADGRSTIANYAPGADCASTLACLAALGVAVTRQADAAGAAPRVAIEGRGLRGLAPTAEPLDCGNSGTTMRMLAGVLAAHPFPSRLVGDPSLSRRPMRRVVEPLARMGARLETGDGGRPPLVVHGADLQGIDFQPDVASAQVKSAVLLAGLQARGRTSVTEPAHTRDHTERALRAFGADVRAVGSRIEIVGGQRLRPLDLTVPGDISSAAFPAAAAAALPGSDVRLEGVGLNPSRMAIVDVLRRFGAEVLVEAGLESHGEPAGALVVRHGGRRDVEIVPAEVPGLIDELPVLAALATFGGALRVTGAGELRVKESDRIAALVEGLRAMGADCDEFPDGFHVRGGRPLTGGTVHARGDHRLAMAFAVAALGAAGPTHIEGAEAVAVSYPSFFVDLDQLRA